MIQNLDVVVQTPTLRGTSIPVGANADVCDNCTDTAADAISPVVPGQTYNAGAVVFLVAPSGTTFANGNGCTTLFSSNAALCAASASYTAPPGSEPPEH